MNKMDLQGSVIAGLCAAVATLFGLYVKVTTKQTEDHKKTEKKLELCEENHTEALVEIAKLKAEVTYLNFRLAEQDKKEGRSIDGRSEDFTG